MNFRDRDWWLRAAEDGTGSDGPAPGEAVEGTVDAGAGDGAAGDEPSGDPLVEASTGEDGAPVPTEPDPKVQDSPLEPKEDWRDKRIAKLTAKTRELQEQLANAGKPGLSEEEVNRRAGEQAERLASAKAFNDACNSVVENGKKTFPDFEARVTNLRKIDTPVAGPNGQTAASPAYNQFISTIVEMGEYAPKIIHALGGDLNEAERILSLSPVKMATELAKLAVKEPGKLSSAPKPITPIGSKSGSSTPVDPTDKSRGDSLSTSEWMARRQAQVDKAWAANRGGRA